MQNDRLLKYGVIGTVVAARGCFTPLLVILFGVVGLSAMVGALDMVLLPVLGVFRSMFPRRDKPAGNFRCLFVIKTGKFIFYAKIG